MEELKEILLGYELKLKSSSFNPKSFVRDYVQGVDYIVSGSTLKYVGAVLMLQSGEFKVTLNTRERTLTAVRGTMSRSSVVKNGNVDSINDYFKAGQELCMQ